MFAGAAREAVFSKKKVIQAINAKFVPVALKAGLVNNPPASAEGRLYREIRRSRIVPQGICVVNPAGRVLNWVLMFDNDKSVLAFLDHALKQYAKYPDGKKPVPTQRYMRFPSKRLKDAQASRIPLIVPKRHPKGQHCPATPPLPAGTLEVRLIGRALGKNGKPVADTMRQENYVEDRFHIPVAIQRRLATALAGAGDKPVRLPNEVVRPFVAHAYLGVLDVQPISNPGRTKGTLKKCRFEARIVKSKKGVSLWSITGSSETHNGPGMANAGPGDMHEVKLTWRGFIELKGNGMTRVVLAAEGKEKLKFGTSRPNIKNEVAFLPAGRRIDLNCGVRYGLTGHAAAGR